MLFYSKWLHGVAMLVAAFSGGFCAQWCIGQAHAQGDPPHPQRLVRATAFELADPADPNKPLAVLRKSAETGGAELILGGPKGQRAIALVAGANGGKISISDDQEVSHWLAESTGSSPSLLLTQGGQKAAIHLQLPAGKPLLQAQAEGGAIAWHAP